MSHCSLLKAAQQFERLQCWYYWREGFMKYAPLRWAKVPWYTYQVSLRLVQAFLSCWRGGGYTYWHTDSKVIS
jgi:hypothetical protein